MKAFRDVFSYILKCSGLKKEIFRMYFSVSVLNSKGPLIHSHFSTIWDKYCYWNRFLFGGYDIKVLRRTRKCVSASSWRLHTVAPTARTSNPRVAVLDFVSKGQAGTWMMCLLSVSAAICWKLPHYVEDPIKCTSGPSAFLLKYCLCRITSHQHSRVGPGHSLRRSNKMYGSWDLAAY